MEAVTGTLGLNWQGPIWHTINFLFLLVLLRLVLYKPVVGMLDDRARRVNESMAQVEQARRAAEETEAQRRAMMEEANRHAVETRNRAEDQAKRIIAEAETRAKEEGSRILAQVQAQATQERQQMLAEVRAQIAALVVSAVDRVTRNALDANSQRTLVQQFLPSEPPRGNGSTTAGSAH